MKTSEGGGREDIIIIIIITSRYPFSPPLMTLMHPYLKSPEINLVNFFLTPKGIRVRYRPVSDDDDNNDDDDGDDDDDDNGGGRLGGWI